MIFCDALVATAKRTQAFAIRQVNVQADARCAIRSRKGPSQVAYPGGFAEGAFVPERHGRVTGVTRTGNVVFLNRSEFMYKNGSSLRNAQTLSRYQRIKLS